MQVTDRENVGSPRQLRANLGPHLGPAINRATQKDKWTLGHPTMFLGELHSDHGGLLRQPSFKLVRGLNDRHRIIWFPAQS